MKHYDVQLRLLELSLASGAASYVVVTAQVRIWWNRNNVQLFGWHRPALGWTCCWTCTGSNSSTGTSWAAGSSSWGRAGRPSAPAPAAPPSGPPPSRYPPPAAQTLNTQSSFCWSRRIFEYGMLVTRMLSGVEEGGRREVERRWSWSGEAGQLFCCSKLFTLRLRSPPPQLLFSFSVSSDRASTSSWPDLQLDVIEYEDGVAAGVVGQDLLEVGRAGGEDDLVALQRLPLAAQRHVHEGLVCLQILQCS